jgi:predicted DNA-binding protein (UPF0251 family)
MSAALMVLPRVWATADASFSGRRRLMLASHALQSAHPPVNPSLRKRPHSLRLIAASAQPQPLQPQPAPSLPQPEVAFYRKYTEAMLQRYLKLSLEAGRVPSLMGRELFRGDVTHCAVHGFDDVVIFVHDVGKCLGRLSPGQRYLVRRIALQGYNQSETAAMIGVSLRTVHSRYVEAIDQLTTMLIEGKLLQPQKEVQRSA